MAPQSARAVRALPLLLLLGLGLAPSLARDLQGSTAATSAAAGVASGQGSQADLGRSLAEKKVPPKTCKKGTKIGGLTYGGGALLSTATINVHLIFYGDWASKFQKECTTASFRNLFNNISATSPDGSSVAQWWSYVAGYCDATTQEHLSYDLEVMDVHTDPAYLQGKDLGDSSSDKVWKVVEKAVKDGNNGEGDANFPKSLYIVLPTAEVSVGAGPDGNECAWTDFRTLSTGDKVPFAVIPEPRHNPKCFSKTLYPKSTESKCNTFTDMAHLVLQVLAEGATDAYGGGWVNDVGFGIVGNCVGQPLTKRDVGLLRGTYPFQILAPLVTDPATGECVLPEPGEWAA